MNGDGVTVGSKGSELKAGRKDFPLGLVEGQVCGCVAHCILWAATTTGD